MSSDEDSCIGKREKFKSEKPIKVDSTDTYCEVDLYGPALPPHFKQSKDTQLSNQVSYGSQLPSNDDGHSKRKGVYGPQFPNELKHKKVIGPEIPAHLLPPADTEEEEDEVSNEDEPGFGPSVSLMSDGSPGIENPSSLLKSTRKGLPEAKAKRQSWMIELPPDRAISFGLGPRQFRTRLSNEKDSDRSGWTETPMEKANALNELEKVNRQNDEKIISQKQIDERNEEMERLVKKISKKKKREESLLEIHRKKMRKKEKKEAKKRAKEGKTAERRPFDRSVDLQIQRFDLAQRNAVLKKAALLNDRFASGESKFL